jgi:hypothetical protein
MVAFVSRGIPARQEEPRETDMLKTTLKLLATSSIAGSLMLGALAPAHAYVILNGGGENGVSRNGGSENGIKDNGFANNGFANNGFANNGFVDNGIVKNGFMDNGAGTNALTQNGGGENGTTYGLSRFAIDSVELPAMR